MAPLRFPYVNLAPPVPIGSLNPLLNPLLPHSSAQISVHSRRSPLDGSSAYDSIVGRQFPLLRVNLSPVLLQPRSPVSPRGSRATILPSTEGDWGHTDLEPGVDRRAGTLEEIAEAVLKPEALGVLFVAFVIVQVWILVGEYKGWKKARRQWNGEWERDVVRGIKERRAKEREEDDGGFWDDREEGLDGVSEREPGPGHTCTGFRPASRGAYAGVDPCSGGERNCAGNYGDCLPNGFGRKKAERSEGETFDLEGDESVGRALMRLRKGRARAWAYLGGQRESEC